MARPRRALSLLVLLLLVAPGQAAPPDGPSFGGTLKEGEAQTFDVPAGPPKSFWWMVLEGGAGCDLDLRVDGGPVKGGKARAWSSALEGAHEELLVPADGKLKATVEHYGGATSTLSLRCTKVEPGKKLAAGATLDGRVAPGAAAFRLHEVPSTGTSFWRVTLAGPPDGDTDLDLQLLDAAGRSLGGSAGEGADESLVLAPSTKPRWVVVRGLGATCPYTLEAEVIGDGAPRLDLDPRAATIEPGEEQFFRLRTSKAGVVIVSLAGPQADGVDLDLEVWGPDGYHRTSAAEDAREEIAINGARRGDYLVRVVAPDETSRGDYTLKAEPLEVSRLAARDPATIKHGPRTWGLYVGIAAYGEDVGELTYTAFDALSVYQTLREVGDGDARRSVVLLDELARREDVVSALRTIAARADEDDTFVFFFSGHGGNDAEDGARGDRKDEQDGGDEYLVCQDSTSQDGAGDLIDDDLAGLLDGLKCRTQLLIIDACYCGGLAELVDREGRWGLFSSLETQESSEAPTLKGGLMTSLVHRALRGEADADRDGEVTTAELSAFVLRIQPGLCPTCLTEVGATAKTCRGCGEPLEGENQRQVAVVADRLASPAVLSRPPKAPR